MTNIIDQFRVNGKVAIVTGGAMGLGKAMAEALAQAGADIVIADIKLDLAEETAQAIAHNEGVKSTALKVDVTNPDDVNKMVQDVVKKYGRIDISRLYSYCFGNISSLLFAFKLINFTGKFKF